jgi:hypothetical protein
MQFYTRKKVQGEQVQHVGSDLQPMLTWVEEQAWRNKRMRWERERQERCVAPHNDKELPLPVQHSQWQVHVDCWSAKEYAKFLLEDDPVECRLPQRFHGNGRGDRRKQGSWFNDLFPQHDQEITGLKGHWHGQGYHKQNVRCKEHSAQQVPCHSHAERSKQRQIWWAEV